MNYCTGLLGKPCSCGLIHTSGGRTVDTKSDEAPRIRVPITLTTADGTLSAPIRKSTVLGTFGWLFLAFAAGYSMGWLLVTYPFFR